MEALAEAMAAHGVPISASQCWRICSALDLKPWQVESWMTSHDPDFWEKAGDVCGLYLNPARKRRGLERGREVRHAGQVPRQSHQASGARASLPDASSSTDATAPRVLFAGLDVHEGTVAGWVTDSTRSENFVEFLGDLVAQTPAGLDLHCIVDNLSTHSTDKVARRSSPSTPTCTCTSPPPMPAGSTRSSSSSPSWNAGCLRRGEFDSVDHLAERVIAFIKDYNRKAAPFRWTYDGRPLMAA